jgi:hypothetical protein
LDNLERRQEHATSRSLDLPGRSVQVAKDKSHSLYTSAPTHTRRVSSTRLTSPLLKERHNPSLLIAWKAQRPPLVRGK